MRAITKIKTGDARIVLSPWFLDYYVQVGYITAQAAVGRWVEVCAVDSCAVYTPEFRWQFDNMTCGEVAKIYEFLKQVLDGPPWPVFKLIRAAFAELRRILRKYCRRI